MISRSDISYRRTFQGAWALSAVVGGYYMERQFMGYTKREATAQFMAEARRECGQ